MAKGEKRNYEGMAVSAEDAAYVRALVIHEDSAVLAFNKPSGLPVQTRNVDDRTLDRLMAAFARSNGKRPRLVHRLDAQTSGVIVAAKTQPAAAALSEAFAQRLVSKTYLALVTGSPFPNDVTEFSMPLSRHIARPGLELMRASRPGDQKSQSAVTRWRVLASSGAAHLLAVEPLTGRMHQIRVHLSIEGRPIVGDPYYGGAGTLKGEPVPRLMLHAASLELPHPTAGGRIVINAPPPADFLAVLSAAGLEMPDDLAMRAI
ncbi:MAG: RluA family pseudouridine synthase [Hyphomonadaceae bacterium]